MKIGIILRNLDNKYEVINNEIITYLNKYNIILVGIVVNQSFDYIKKLIDECKGIILPGGIYENSNDKKIIKYLHKINKPTLGICLGAEEMSECFNGKLIKIKNNKHNSSLKYVHKIYIKDNTLLKKIINKDYILVNSRHSFEIKDTTLNVCAYSYDNVIEAIEDSNKLLFLGLCYHPESLINDINSKKIIDYFINICEKT
jgi:anthranilate/para-aminobenzoate synthase component II